MFKSFKKDKINIECQGLREVLDFRDCSKEVINWLNFFYNV
jgi:hypothetical protein